MAAVTFAAMFVRDWILAATSTHPWRPVTVYWNVYGEFWTLDTPLMLLSLMFLFLLLRQAWGTTIQDVVKRREASKAEREPSER